MLLSPPLASAASTCSWCVGDEGLGVGTREGRRRRVRRCRCGCRWRTRFVGGGGGRRGGLGGGEIGGFGFPGELDRLGETYEPALVFGALWQNWVRGVRVCDGLAVMPSGTAELGVERTDRAAMTVKAGSCILIA